MASACTLPMKPAPMTAVLTLRISSVFPFADLQIFSFLPIHSIIGKSPCYTDLLVKI